MENLANSTEEQTLVLNNGENPLGRVHDQFANYKDELQNCANNRTDGQRNADESATNSFSSFSRAELNENERIDELNERHSNDVPMQDEEADEHSSQLEQPASPIEADECMKRKLRLRNDLNKRKLRHLNKRRAEQTGKHVREEDSLDEDEPEDGEINQANYRIHKRLASAEQSNNQQNSNIVDLLTKNSSSRQPDEEEERNEENLNEDSIKKATAYLGLQKLIQLLQQQQQQQTSSQPENNQEEEDNQQENTAEPPPPPPVQPQQNPQSAPDNNQKNIHPNNNQPTNSHARSEPNKSWLLNAAAATFPLERGQCEALAKQSPALLHQQLMMVQLLQQLQQQQQGGHELSATAAAAAGEERPNEPAAKPEKSKPSTNDEPMDCDQQQSTGHSPRSLFDLQKSTSITDTLNSKSKLNFGNLTPSSTAITHQPTNTTSTAGAPMPTRPAHTMNPISTSSSLFTTSSSITSINNQLNRLSNPLQQNNSNQLNRPTPIENLILMPDDLSSGVEAQPPSKNPLELLQHTAEKALQKTMKGASFLVNGDGENNENNADDPANKHKCKFCEKVFGSDSAMQIHIRSHTGERPFKCNVCGNRFSTRGNLKVHFTRHAQKYPNVKMNSQPIPEHMDKFFPPIEPPGSSQSPPAQFQPEDDLLAVNNISINFAQALAQQKQRQQLQDINALAANLSTDRLETFSRELLLANSNNFLLKNPPNSNQLNEAQLMSLPSSRSSAAAKLETIELVDNSVKESLLEGKQKKAVNDSMNVLSVPDQSFKASVLNQLNQNIPVTGSSASSSALNLQQLPTPTSKQPSKSPTFGQLNNIGSQTNKENDSSDELSSMMLDYLLKAKQRKAADQPEHHPNEFVNDKSGNMNAILNELAQQQAFNPNLAAATAAASLVSSLFSSFLPPNLQPSIYQQLPAYLSQLLQHQLPFAAQQQQQQQQQLTNNGSSVPIDQSSTVASLLQLSAAQTNLLPNNNHSLDISPELGNLNNSNNLIKTHHSTSPGHRNQASPIASGLQQQQQNLLGTVLNLNNSMATRSTGRNSPNSSFNSAHDFDLNSVLSSSPRNSPNIRQQLSQLAALTTSSSNSNPHQLITSPTHSLVTNTTPTPSQTSSINAYQDLLPKPGSTDNAWESLMEVEKDSEAAKIKKLVENCDQKITDPNQCLVCQRILSCKSALQMHYRTHTGERPFKCKLCQRAFTTKGNLKTHMSVHRQKPSLRSMHECPVCRQQFTNALVLQQHVKQQHNQPDERQLIQAHQKAQQQLQYAAAMERIMMAAHQQKTGENLGFPANLADDPFFASLQQQNFNFAQFQAQLQASMERQSNDENSLEAAAQQFFSQNGRFSEMFKQSFNDENSRNYEEDEEFDEKEEMSDSKENNDEDLEETADELDRNLDGDLEGEENDDEESQNPQANENDNSDHNSSPNDSFHQQLANSSRQSEQVQNMNEDSIASTISSSAGALDLTPKQQQAMAAHLQQLNNNMNNSSNSSQSSGSGNGNGSQLLNIPNMPSFQLSARGANTTCRICLKTFACASALTIHYRSHSKERPFKCQVCERGFSTKGNMKQHLLTHKLRDFPPNVLGPNLNVSGNNQLSSLMMNAAASVMNGGGGNSGLANHSASSNHSAEQFIGSKATAADLNGLKEKLDLAGVINAVNGSGENCLLKSSSSSTSSGASASKQSRALAQNLAQQRQQLQQLNGDCQSDASCEANEADERRSVTSLNGSGQFERSGGGNLSGNESSTSSLLNNSELKRIGNLTNSITSNLAASLNSTNASTSSTVSNGVSAELKHMCDICVKPFSSHSALQIHNRTHTGEKPFACRICSRPFTTKGNLKVHMGTHMGTHMFSSQSNSRRGRRISVEMNFPNFNLMESNNWIG